MVLDSSAIESFRLRAKEQGFKALENQIIFRELCAGCGACSAVCPKDVIEFSDDGHPVLGPNAECISCGLCAVHCPRSFLDIEAIEGGLFQGEKDELGYHVQVLSARATDPEVRSLGQDGGVTSAMVKCLFGDKGIDGAALCRRDERFIGSPFLAKDWEEAMQASRSKYNLSPNLVVLRQARLDKLERVALVGLPCHIAAFRKIEFMGPKNLATRVSIAIGLFCSENFCNKMISDFLPSRGVDPAKIRKLNIKGKFMVDVGDQVIEIPLPEMKSVVNPGCLPCRDFTAELADVSVGAVGSPDGWCTVISRTSKGDALVRKMIEGGIIETGKLTKPKTLRRMSRSKWTRGNRRLLEIMHGEADLPLRMAEIPSQEAGSEEE